MRRNPIVREVSDFTLPAILLVALYIQFHGEYSPGGGFQAGVVFGTGVWLYALVHGLARTQRIIPPPAVRAGVSLGALLYIGTGFACLLLGENFLDYDALGGGHGGGHGDGDGHNTHGQHLGILLIELGVGITVASVMVTVFYGFAARRGARGHGNAD
ncbi:MAG: Na(+)/H(+) antiporter subunit B [Halofilum sp. (in: g-proteobacteria)]|nr:Na(+)/H(+) antiporter subunit B [Halofilum sp. (in: g-proteobacteria)]